VRGTDPDGLERAAARCASLISIWAGGSVARGIAEDGSAPERRWVAMRPSRASMLLDYPVSTADAAGVFDRLRLTHRDEDDRVDVEVPGYRVDIEREEDLIEEVARIEGYDRIGSKTVSAAQVGALPDGYRFRERLRDALVRAGLRDVRPLPFASAEDLALTGDEDAIAVANPLQADDGFLRARLLPGLLRTVARNQARGVESVALFETGTVFTLADDVDERPQVAWALCGPATTGWSGERREFDVLDASGILRALMDELAITDWTLGEIPEGPFHPGRSSTVLVNGQRAGVVGEIHPRVAAEVEIDGRVAVAELEVRALLAATTKEFAFKDVPRFPPVRRDLAFVVAEDVAAGAVETALREAAGELLARCELFDVFRGGSLPEGTKSFAFTLEFRAPDRTLTGEETDPLVERVVARLARDFGAELRAG
jgi:phenylalanyl-tRNA synthetase beta chain